MFRPSVTDMGSLYEEMRAIRESMEGTGEAPQTMHTQEDPNIEAEDYNMEDYSKDDLEKVKSKTEDVTKEVKDDELVQKPAKPSDKVTKESKNIKENISHPLHLCNECSRTFRNSKRICLYCSSGDVLPIVHITEGILELVGEIEGIDRREQVAVRQAVEKGLISSEWPGEDDMIDALSSLEDFVNPENEPGDLRQAYLRHIIVPKALSVLEEAIDEQEEAPEDHSAEARKAELKAKMAEKEQAHARELERMAKELEGMS